MQLIELLSTEPVEKVSADADVVEAARLMRDHDTGALFVVADGRLAGVITDRDIVVRSVADELMRSARVRDIMSVEVVTAFGDQTVEEAKELIAEHGITRLPVVDREHQPLGILSLASLENKEEAQKKPLKVTAYKEKTDSTGRPHKVPLRTVYVTSKDSEEEAKDVAARIVEKEQRTPFVADGLAAEKMPSKPAKTEK